MKKDQEQSFFDAYEDFFEELSGHHDEGFGENLEIGDPDAYQGGLTKENVHKLTEDLMNPLPPTDENQ